MPRALTFSAREPNNNQRYEPIRSNLYLQMEIARFNKIGELFCIHAYHFCFKGSFFRVICVNVSVLFFVLILFYSPLLYTVAYGP